MCTLVAALDRILSALGFLLSTGAVRELLDSFYPALSSDRAHVQRAAAACVAAVCRMIRNAPFESVMFTLMEGAHAAAARIAAAEAAARGGGLMDNRGAAGQVSVVPHGAASLQSAAVEADDPFASPACLSSPPQLVSKKRTGRHGDSAANEAAPTLPPSSSAASLLGDDFHDVLGDGQDDESQPGGGGGGGGGGGHAHRGGGGRDRGASASSSSASASSSMSSSLDAYTRAHDAALAMLCGYTTALGLVIAELPPTEASRAVFARHFGRVLSTIESSLASLHTPLLPPTLNLLLEALTFMAPGGEGVARMQGVMGTLGKLLGMGCAGKLRIDTLVIAMSCVSRLAAFVPLTVWTRILAADGGGTVRGFEFFFFFFFVFFFFFCFFTFFFLLYSHHKYTTPNFFFFFFF
jgi:hypothetical protein